MEMNIKNQLKGMDITKVKMSNGKTLGQNLHQQAEYLRSLIQKHLDNYLDNNSPEYYYLGDGKRTGSLAKSVKVEDIAQIRLNGNKLEICVYFDENAYHGSGYGAWKENNSPDVNVAELLNYGYAVKKDIWFKDIANFGYREGAYFVEDAIDEFNATNTLGMYIDKDRDIIR